MDETVDSERAGGRRRRKYRILPLPGAPTLPPDPPRPRTLAEVALARYGRSRAEMISEAAYYRASARGFAGGDPERDWVEAEREIDRMLRDEA